MAFAKKMPNKQNQEDFEIFEEYEWRKQVEVILDFYGYGINWKVDIKSAIIYCIKRSNYFVGLLAKEQIDDIIAKWLLLFGHWILCNDDEFIKIYKSKQLGYDREQELLHILANDSNIDQYFISYTNEELKKDGWSDYKINNRYDSRAYDRLEDENDDCNQNYKNNNFDNNSENLDWNENEERDEDDDNDNLDDKNDFNGYYNAIDNIKFDMKQVVMKAQEYNVIRIERLIEDYQNYCNQNGKFPNFDLMKMNQFVQRVKQRMAFIIDEIKVVHIRISNPNNNNVDDDKNTYQSLNDVYQSYQVIDDLLVRILKLNEKINDLDRIDQVSIYSRPNIDRKRRFNHKLNDSFCLSNAGDNGNNNNNNNNKDMVSHDDENQYDGR